MDIIKKYYLVITALIVFIIYLVTLAPSVIQIDSGELAAVQALAGIAHPTGYPLFTLSGYLFSLIPLPFSTIYKLNSLAALWCAAGIFMFLLSAKLLLENLGAFQVIKPLSKKEKKRKEQPAVRQELPEIKKITAIAAGALVLAFSKTFWFQSTSVEVYSLHIFLVISSLYFLLRAYLKQENDVKQWLVFAFVLALGFTNHMTMLLILPGTAYLFFLKHGFNKKAFKIICLMLLIFFPVLILVYAYLPIRAVQDPLINWGNPVDFERLYRHVSGKQYQVWLFSSAEAAKKQLVYFFESITDEFNISLFISLFGMISSFLLARRIFIFLLITFISTVLYSINYDIVDIDSYFLLAYITLSMFAVFGAVKLLSMLKFENYVYTVSTGLIGIFILVQFYFNYEKVNQNSTYSFEDYTKELLGSTKKNSLIFSYQWDYFISPSYYFQFIENYRRDISIVDKELLRRSWYYNQLDNTSPGIISGIKTERELFLAALQPFEKDENFDSNLLERLYRQLMTSLIASNIAKRDIYIGPELFENEMQRGEFVLPDGYTLVPDIFLFKVVKGNKYMPAANPDFTIRFPEKRNHYTGFIEKMTGAMLVRRALYELQFDKVDRAKLYIEKIKQDLPGYTIPSGIANALK